MMRSGRFVGTCAAAAWRPKIVNRMSAYRWAIGRPIYTVTTRGEAPRVKEDAIIPGMKIGLYSITYLGIWYHGPALTIEELIERARTFGYDGIEIDGKRPHG